MKKRFILASLVIFLANPMLAMERESKEISNAMPIGLQKALIDPFNRWPEDMPTQEKLNALLIRAIKIDDIEAAINLLRNNANPNSYDRETDFTALMLAAKKGSHSICIPLLAHGADLRAKNESNHSALTLAMWRHDSRLSKNLIVWARFYPIRPATELKISQDRIFTALLCWKKVCPRYLPKDIRKLLLVSYLQEDALNCQTHFCENMIHLMPPQIACKLLEQDQAIAQLKKYKFEQLTPLLREVSGAVLSHPLFNVQIHHKEFGDMLNPELLEQNFGKEIESVILADCLRDKGDIHV